MDLKLLPENDPLLRNISEPWDFEKDGDPLPLVTTMTRLLFEYNGIGLAAPQCGILKRLFIMGNKDKLYVCINPRILSGEEQVRDIEGCLSFPDLWLFVARYKTITVQYQTVSGEVKEEIFSDLIARVYQHESDHLDGVCFDTKVGSFSLKRATDKRKKKL